MRRALALGLTLGAIALSAHAATVPAQTQYQRKEAEYYADAYADHYGVPKALVEAIIQQESGWRPCVVSDKGAVGLMQLMPETAAAYGVQDRCSIMQNISGGVQYLAYLMSVFGNRLRLVVAAYYCGEHEIEAHGLQYSNPDVVRYVRSVRQIYQQELAISSQEQTLYKSVPNNPPDATLATGQEEIK